MLSRLVITFLPRSKRLLISWLQSLSAVILEQRKPQNIRRPIPPCQWARCTLLSYMAVWCNSFLYKIRDSLQIHSGTSLCYEPSGVQTSKWVDKHSEDWKPCGSINRMQLLRVMVTGVVLENSWESLGLQDQTSQSQRKSVLNIHWKDWCWSWNSNTLATWCKELTPLKRPWCWERLKVGREGDDRGWDGWMASPTQWMWVWASSGSWWRTGKPDVRQSMGSQRVRHNWATELNWWSSSSKCFYKWIQQLIK